LDRFCNRACDTSSWTIDHTFWPKLKCEKKYTRVPCLFSSGTNTYASRISRRHSVVPLVFPVLTVGVRCPFDWSPRLDLRMYVMPSRFVLGFLSSSYLVVFGVDADDSGYSVCDATSANQKVVILALLVPKYSPSGQVIGIS